MGIPAPLDTGLARVIVAYRHGRGRPVAMSPGPAGTLFRSLAQAHISARLAEPHLAQYIAVRDRSREAVRLARAGDWTGAERLFAEADALAAAPGRTEEVRWLARSWIDQAYAYLAARRRDWAEAHQRLRSAMAADLALETGFGYGLFHIGRVHTLHLWMRTDAQAGRRARAVDLAQEIIDYVGGRRDGLSVGDGWSAARAAAVPEDLRFAMTARIASEVGAVLAPCPPGEAGALLARFPAWRGFEGHPRLSDVHGWGVAKEAFVAGDTRAFLQAAEPVLAAGRGETTLWYATAFDACRVLSALRPAAVRAFREEVAEDAASWRQLPQEVQAPLLGALLAAAPAGDAGRAFIHRAPRRRFHICTVGLPRTGTTSLFTLFANYRSGNEFMERETITQVVRVHGGTLPADEFDAYLNRRDLEGGLEMDSASFHHLYLDRLVDRWPEARFVCTIREPYAWANSYLRMLLGWHQRFAAQGEEPPPWMADYGTMLFGRFAWDSVRTAEAIAEAGRPLVDAFLRHWAEANRRTLALLPPGRSLVVRTDDLSARVADLADLAGVPAATLTGAHHSNASPDRRDLLEGIGRAWVEARARRHGADVVAAIGAWQGQPA